MEIGWTSSLPDSSSTNVSAGIGMRAPTAAASSSSPSSPSAAARARRPRRSPRSRPRTGLQPPLETGQSQGARECDWFGRSGRRAGQGKGHRAMEEPHHSHRSGGASQRECRFRRARQTNRRRRRCRWRKLQLRRLLRANASWRLGHHSHQAKCGGGEYSCPSKAVGAGSRTRVMSLSRTIFFKSTHPLAISSTASGISAGTGCFAT